MNINDNIFKNGFAASMDANQIELLSKDIPSPNIDPFEPNHFYGNSHVLKFFSGVDVNQPVERIMPHGVNLGRQPWDIEEGYKIDTILCHSKIQARDYKSDKTILPIGAPYYYASRAINNYCSSVLPRANGVIVFPAHSTDHLKAVYQEEDWFSALNQVRSFYDITICLYWKDVQLGRHKKYLDLGYSVTTCGHILDPLFLYRLAWLLKQQQHAFVNKLGSSAYYSAAEGLEISFFNQQVTFDGPENFKSELSDCFDAPHAIDFFTSFSLFGNAKKQLQLKTAHEALGGAYLKSPDQLAKILTEDIPADYQEQRKTESGSTQSGPTLSSNVLDAMDRL